MKHHLGLQRASSSFSSAILKIPDPQVAGYRACNGKLGPLMDHSGRFYKPLEHNERGFKGLAFHTSFFSDMEVPNDVRRFFPAYYGTQSPVIWPYPHLVSGRVNPTIINIKNGSRIWYPRAADECVKKCLKKD